MPNSVRTVNFFVSIHVSVFCTLASIDFELLSSVISAASATPVMSRKIGFLNCRELSSSKPFISESLQSYELAFKLN